MQCAKCNEPVEDGGYFVAVELLPARESKRGHLCANCFDLPDGLKPVPDESAKVVAEAKAQALAEREKKAAEAKKKRAAEAKKKAGGK